MTRLRKCTDLVVLSDDMANGKGSTVIDSPEAARPEGHYRQGPMFPSTDSSEDWQVCQCESGKCQACQVPKLRDQSDEPVRTNSVSEEWIAPRIHPSFPKLAAAIRKSAPQG